MKSLLILVVAGAATFSSPVMTLAAPTSIAAAPFPIVKTDHQIVNTFVESTKHRHIQMKRVVHRSRSNSNSIFDSYASFPYDGVSGFAPPIVSSGNPGNPYLNDDFDRAVEQNEYNGG